LKLSEIESEIFFVNFGQALRAIFISNTLNMATNRHLFGASLQQILADRGSDLGVKQVPDWLTEICKFLKEGILLGFSC
jgi:hypothetical protein